MKIPLLLLLVFNLIGCFGSQPEKTDLKGKEIPSFKILLTDSLTYLDTKSISSGKPSVLFYFGPNCPYSRAQLEEILSNMTILKNINFYLFTSSPFNQMMMFYNHYHLDKYSNITVGLDNTYFFKDYFKTPGVPYIAIYNKEKKLNESYLGKIDSKQINKIAFN